MIDTTVLKQRFEQLSIRILSKQAIGSVTYHDVYAAGGRAKVERTGENVYAFTYPGKRTPVTMDLDTAVETLTALHFGDE